MKHATVCLLAFFLAANAGAAPQATRQPTPAQEPVIKSGAEEVVLDVIVRDKQGRAVNNLTSADFEVFDNGERKTVKSFRLVEGAEAVNSSGQRTALDPLRQIRLVTLIFSGLDLTARHLAREASLDLIKSELPQNVYMAVMVIDHKLEVLAPFTNDRETLKKAIQHATGTDTTNFSNDTLAVQKQLESMLGPNGSGTPGLQARVDAMTTGAASASGPGSKPDGASMANIQAAQMLLQMIQSQESSAMTDWGRTNIFALLDAVREQYRLPGRKTILFLSSGFAIPQGTEEPFRSVISIANRSNVSFYPIDVRGVGASSNADAVKMLNDAANSSRRQAQSTGYEAIRPDEVGVFDKGIDSSRANTQNTLAQLAEETGGKLIANTNDFKAPMRRINEDIQTYYEITYVPEIQRYDGSFRKIAVKTDRAELKVQSRSGYFALPPSMVSGGNVVHSYEVPLLAALDSTELPRNFPYAAEGVHYRTAKNQPLGGLVVDVPLSGLTAKDDKAANASEYRFAYLAIVKNQNGEVVKKFQNDIERKIPADKAAALAQSHFIYTEHFELPPGRYALQTAVLDRESDKISARKSSFMVPASDGSLGISSVVVVRNLKDKDAQAPTDDPLQMGPKVISPTINPVISKATTDSIQFYTTLYPSPQETAKPQLIMEFSKDGQALGSGTPELAAPNADGQIQYVANVPTKTLPPGSYRVHFVVKQGTHAADEWVSFTIE